MDGFLSLLKHKKSNSPTNKQERTKEILEQNIYQIQTQIQTKTI